MNLKKPNAELFFPSPLGKLERTTSLCIAAHQDDVEIMAYGAIADCYGSQIHHFTGVVVTDGGGSPRSGVYADYTDDDMKKIRAAEQKNAACIGRYNAQFQLAYPSSEVKDPQNRILIEEIKAIILATSPEIVYTHNPADKHDTHVATCLHVIRAICELPIADRPQHLYGMEVWRGLDWMPDDDKIVENTAKHPAIAAALLGVFDSQVGGGKRYDLATIGRRLANATFFASHAVDEFDSMSIGMDLTPAIHADVDVTVLVQEHITKFSEEIQNKIQRFK